MSMNQNTSNHTNLRPQWKIKLLFPDKVSINSETGNG